MTSKELISKLDQIFSKDKKLEQRYYYELEWLNARKNKWSSNKIRVGFIGVTSSGKSTLLNAILGEEILSMAVRPSSNQIVSCYKSEINRAEIILHGGKSKILSGSNLTEKNLSRYCDEGANKNNRENVEEIRLSTSTFDFADDIVLIDSAGLDAYKLENHERLTLEVLLPTIDICVLVSTLMGSSDEKVRSTLKVIDKYNIPILVVQNMLDSVEPSADGSKTKEMVADDHRKRMQRIINESNIHNKDSIQIVQVSARQAMEARCKGKNPPDESRYEEFRKTLKWIIDEYRPVMDQERMQSVLNHYEEFLNQEKSFISNQPTKVLPFEHEGLLGEISEQVGKSFGKMDQVIKAMDVNSNQNMPGTDVCMNDIFSFDDVERMSSLSTSFVTAASKLIIEQISYFNKYMEKVCRKIGIPSRDLIYEPHVVSVPEPKVYHTQVAHTTRKEKSGFGGKLKRFLGAIFGRYDWGYEEVYDGTCDQVDEIRTKEGIKNYIQKSQKAYGNEMSKWKKNIEKQLKKVEEEYRRLEVSYELRKKSSLENEAVKDIIREVEQELRKVKSSISAIKVKKERVMGSSANLEKKMTEMSLTDYQTNLMHLSRNWLQSISIGYLLELRKREKYPKKSIICGWDELSLQDVRFRFFEKSILSKWKQESETIFLLAPTSEKLKEQMGKTECSIFILINAQQDGSAKNQISKLNLNKLVRKNDRIFFIVQDFQNLLQSHGISEMRINLQEYYSDFNIEQNRGVILINADNPVYCMAFAEEQLQPCNSQKEEREFIQMLQNSFPELMSEAVKSAVDALIRVKKV